MSVRGKVTLAAIVVMLMALSACVGAEARALEEKDSGSKLELSVGEEVTVRLPSNVTTGFSWELVDAGGLTQVGEPKYEEPQASQSVGAGGTQVFTFTAKRVGSGELLLEYRRPWEKDVPAEKNWRAGVEVR